MAGIPGILPPTGAIAVIFVALRTEADDEGYGAAARRMDELAKTQPGYLGLDSARGDDGLGVTVSYWADAASAKAWKANAEHAAVRDMGRERWYAHYRLIVASVDHAYAWTKSVDT